MNTERYLLIAVLAFVAGFLVATVGITGNPWQICTEAKAKGIVLFSCEKVKLP